MFLKILLTVSVLGWAEAAHAQNPTPSADSSGTSPASGLTMGVRADNVLNSRAFRVDSNQTRATLDTVRPELRPSPVALAVYKDESNYLKLVYGQPFKKGRVIFGSIAKWGQVWRTGANEATEITFTPDMKFDGRVCRAGTYTLFTIPNPDKWTIILNSELGQWGAYGYKPERDVLRFDVPVQKSDQIFEALTFKFIETDAGADLVLHWDEVMITVPIMFSR